MSHYGTFVEAYPVAFDQNETPRPLASASAPISSSAGSSIVRINQNPPNVPAIREYLTSCKWPTGLQDTFIANLSKMPVRFFICDDSGSMNTDDGHRLHVNRQGVGKFINCTRWAELTSALTFHANVSFAANQPTQFRLLNAGQPITIGNHTLGAADSTRDLDRFLDILKESPRGKTPLCVHIREVIQQIEGMADELRRNGQKACVIIASDGESTDGDVSSALKPLERLPAWVVIRLCTDEDRIVNYWNNIDNDLEFDIDVLDDLEGEAKEIAEVNPWLTYGEPLHRLREFGIPIKEIDLLDSHALNQDQMRLFCSLLFGGRVENYPHPAEDWRGFVSVTREKNRGVGKVFHPIKKRNVDWVNPSKIPSHYRGGGCVIL